MNETRRDAVERAAKAIYMTNQISHLSSGKEGWITPFGELSIDAKKRYFQMAEAAIIAAAVEPEPGLSLESLFDSAIDDGIWFEFIGLDHDGFWEVVATKGETKTGFRGNSMELSAAVAAAVRQANASAEGSE